MAEFGSTGLGSTLRAERLRRGMELAAIAAQTKIRYSVLEAIERDQFERMPGGAYRRSFLRQYARALGVDEGEALSAFFQQFTEPRLPLPIPPKQTKSTRFREWAWVFVAVAALGGVYRVTDSGPIFPAAPEVMVARLEPVTLPPAPSAAAAAPALALAQTVASVPDSSQVRVAFTATEAVWLSVRCDGTLSYTGTLRGQEMKTFEASKVVTVLVGNAGGLAISLDGRAIGPVGSHGQTQLLELTAGGARKLPFHSAPEKAAGTEPKA